MQMHTAGSGMDQALIDAEEREEAQFELRNQMQQGAAATGVAYAVNDGVAPPPQRVYKKVEVRGHFLGYLAQVGGALDAHEKLTSASVHRRFSTPGTTSNRKKGVKEMRSKKTSLHPLFDLSNSRRYTLPKYVPGNNATQRKCKEGSFRLKSHPSATVANCPASLFIADSKRIHHASLSPPLDTHQSS